MLRSSESDDISFQSELAPVSADNDQDALHDIFSTPTDDLSKQDAIASDDIELEKGNDENTISNLLSDELSDFEPSEPLAQSDIDSAGMDFESMLSTDALDGDDWAGFDSAASITQPEPQIQETVAEPSSQPFMTIDELMAQVESEEQGIDPDEEELKLDVWSQ